MAQTWVHKFAKLCAPRQNEKPRASTSRISRFCRNLILRVRWWRGIDYQTCLVVACHKTKLWQGRDISQREHWWQTYIRVLGNHVEHGGGVLELISKPHILKAQVSVMYCWNSRNNRAAACEADICPYRLLQHFVLSMQHIILFLQPHALLAFVMHLHLWILQKMDV